MQHYREIENPVHMLALWVFHNFPYLLENGKLTEHHNGDDHSVLA